MTPSPPSHFNGKTFFYPGEVAERGLADVLRWKLSSHPVPWPARVGFLPQPLPPVPAAGAGVAVTWIGHSTFLLRAAGLTILTDPVFSERASPFTWIGPKRHMAPGLDLDHLPQVDLILLSHDHFDHCDLPSLRRLGERYQPRIITPLKYRSLLAGTGLGPLTELDWWDQRMDPGGAEVQLVPARHWCRRSVGGTNLRLWGGFILQLGGRRLYFAGDTGYDDTLFREIGRRAGPPDLALLPIGAYEPRWFMQSAHANPAEAVHIHRDLGARRSVAMHWGTFQLTDEGRDQPVQALAVARARAGLTEADFTVLEPSGSVLI